MSETPILQMRIFELRNKLKEKGLSSSGTKSELISRLSQFYEETKEELISSESEKKIDEQIQPGDEVQELIPVKTEYTKEIKVEVPCVNNTPDEIIHQKQIEEPEEPVIGIISEYGEVQSVSKEQSQEVSCDLSAPEPACQQESKRACVVTSDIIDTGTSILESRCKRFGIPFNPNKILSIPTTKRVKSIEIEAMKNMTNEKLEERKKRFGTASVEKKEMTVKNLDRNIPARKNMFQGVSKEEKEKLESRMKRFGLK